MMFKARWGEVGAKLKVVISQPALGGHQDISKDLTLSRVSVESLKVVPLAASRKEDVGSTALGSERRAQALQSDTLFEHCLAHGVLIIRREPKPPRAEINRG